jgi:hypothetical protein
MGDRCSIASTVHRRRATGVLMVVAQAIQKFFDIAEYPVIFTGAGVSVRAGLPTWGRLVEMLAEGVRSVDPMTTQQMLECIREGRLTLAVEYFRLSPKILDGDRQKLLVRLLSTYDARAILPIAKLPFRGCLTTNFDRSILDALAIERAKSPRDYRYGDQSFKQAQWEESLFVARIHGAVEAPESMILSDGQFKNLLNDDSYIDLLGQCFLHRNLLFLGFSFYDPAVRHVLLELNRRFGAAAPGRHLAIVPRGMSSEFLQKATRLNIDLVEYDQADDHAEFWSGISSVTTAASQAKSPQQVPQVVPFSATKQFLAACYARAKTQPAAATLRGAVVEGIIAAILQESAPRAVSRGDVLERVRTSVGLKGSQAECVVDGALKALRDAGLCRKHKGEGGRGAAFAWHGDVVAEDSLVHAIGILTKSLKDRAVLQEGWQPPVSLDSAMARFFGEIVRRRGWDLGAAFAVGRAPELVSVNSLLLECTTDLPTFDRQRLARVCQSMFEKPSEEEAAVLSELGRISFAVELAFQAPRSILLHNAILPRQIYFDASVLMPAIVTGHPFSALYLDAIGRLRTAAAAAAVDLRLKVCTGYLNEIIKHRANAIEFSRQFSGDFAEIARADALFHGSANVNVYVGAYANWINSNGMIQFSDFLNRFAPYSSEKQLKSWLEGKGFHVVTSIKSAQYAEFLSVLEQAYADRFSRGKGTILIDHDATQLSMLYEESRKGEKVLFITADLRLQEIVANSAFYSMAELMMNHISLVQFIDLVLGGISDGAALAQLLWSARISDQAQAVRAYFTTLALERYDDGMAMAMPKMLDAFTASAVEQMRRQSADLDAEDPRARAAAFRVLGSLEKNYLSGMSDAVTKLRTSIGGAGSP